MTGGCNIRDLHLPLIHHPWIPSYDQTCSLAANCLEPLIMGWIEEGLISVFGVEGWREGKKRGKRGGG